MAEGVARSLNPNANIWLLAKPLASDWVQAQTGFTLKLQQIFTDIDRTFRILPKILDDYEHTLTEKKPAKSNYEKSMFKSNFLNSGNS